MYAQVSDLHVDAGRCAGVVLENGDVIRASGVVLAVRVSRVWKCGRVEVWVCACPQRAGGGVVGVVPGRYLMAIGIKYHEA